MKRVRFESPRKFSAMGDSDLHSPRPFIRSDAIAYSGLKPAPSIQDALQAFDYSDSAPYFQPQKIATNNDLLSQNLIQSTLKPTEQLDLSMLDCSEPRTMGFTKFCNEKPKLVQELCANTNIVQQHTNNIIVPTAVPEVLPPNILAKENSFFIKRDNLEDVTSLKKTANKENEVLKKKLEVMKTVTQIPGYCASNDVLQPSIIEDNICACHHCKNMSVVRTQQCKNVINTCCQYPNPPSRCLCSQQYVQPAPILKEQNIMCKCHNTKVPRPQNSPKNAVDKKTWAIEKFVKSRSNSNELEKATAITKENKEPTLSDLFAIIKLQNEQLQRLQDKVDSFISSSNQTQQPQVCSHPVQNYYTEKITLETFEDNKKISIGVMTSFETRQTAATSNDKILNKSAQIQCNRSEISVKNLQAEQPVNVNFLDGLKPVDRSPHSNNDEERTSPNVGADRNYNDYSLCNIQVNNGTTPSLSPEQTMYLDIRDFSSGSDVNKSEQSNVGWTYYNKVMTHVNGMLNESEMPSSASALFRNTRQHCLQMQIDKTNVSVTKRVTFGENHLHLQRGQVFPAPTTETSMKMNQLAAKYLANERPVMLQQIPKPPTVNLNNMSMATRNYMERHHLLPGMSPPSPPLPQIPPHAAPASPIEMPRFLDITALKQQPKFL